MNAFTQLFLELDRTTRTSEKVAAMRQYFETVPPEDAAWAVYFLTGRKLKRIVTAPQLRAFAGRASGLPEWLVDASYEAVGDLAETIALLLPTATESTHGRLNEWVNDRLIPLRSLAIDEQYLAVAAAWRDLGPDQRFVWNKLLTGAFRVGVSQQLVTRALAEVAGVPSDVIAHRMMGDWAPTTDFFASLLRTETDDADISRPYPFHLAYPLESTLETLGDRSDWQVEWKWDGIRAQLVRREGQTFLWSRGEELVTERFPEIAAAAETLPDGVAIDGEILAWADGAVLGFGELQRRIGRKTVTAKMQRDVPVVLLAFDLVEDEGIDIRTLPFEVRRRRLVDVLARVDDGTRARLMLSPVVDAPTWEALAAERDDARSRRVEGVMLKRLDSPYRVGRHRSEWWKWKIDPLTVDAVLLYAQRGHGRRANLYTDYTFAVWRDADLVPFAKAYSGLTDAEILEVDRFVRANTREQFGPVRSVVPELVFELAFEGIQRSTRHKSGIAVRFPRMVRWRRDKRPEDADSLATIGGMLDAYENAGRQKP